MLALGPLSRAFERVPRLHAAVQKVLQRAKDQASTWGKDNVFWALALFVGVPLPGTGAWSGAVVAFVLGMPLTSGLAANALGVLIAGALVTTLTCMGWAGFFTAVTILMLLPFMTWLVRNIREDPNRHCRRKAACVGSASKSTWSD